MSDFAEDVVQILDSIVNEPQDAKRMAIESPNLQPYKSGLQDGDPVEQPSQDKEPQE